MTIQHREGGQTTQSHTARQRQVQDANPITLVQKPKLTALSHTGTTFSLYLIYFLLIMVSYAPFFSLLYKIWQYMLYIKGGLFK